MKIVISGGGTGGHIYPALAFVRTVKKLDGEADILYIGTEKGLESSLVPREGIPFKTIDITGFKRKLSLDNVKTVMKFIKGVKVSKQILQEFKPDIVIGTGGYVCGPVVYAAHLLKIPTIIHEQNSIPGLTNKFLSRYVDKIAISFEQSARFFPKDKVVLTGNPRASEVLGHDGKKGLEQIGLKKDQQTVLIFAGSRGARPVNEAVIQSFSEFAKKSYQILYITGEIHYESVMKQYELSGSPKNVHIKPFIHRMPEILAGVDLVVSRAGATSLAEFTSLGLPSILIPSPYVTNNHQEKNALSLQEKGAAIVILEKDLTGNRLIKEIDQILGDARKIKQMQERAKKLGIQDASERLYNLTRSLIEKNKRNS